MRTQTLLGWVYVKVVGASHSCLLNLMLRRDSL